MLNISTERRSCHSEGKLSIALPIIILKYNIKLRSDVSANPSVEIYRHTILFQARIYRGELTVAKIHMSNYIVYKL